LHGHVLALTAAALFGLSSAALANDSRPAGARQTYQQDRAACESGQSNQDRATCLREAGAALQRSRHPRANEPAEDPATLQRNRLARCDLQPSGGDRDDCVRMMNGEGQTSGSVAAGGVFRELTTVVPAGG
jgi:hypothetical protein